MEILSSNSDNPPRPTWQAGVKAVRGQVLFIAVMIVAVLKIPFLRSIIWALMWMFVSLIVSITFSYLRVAHPERVTPLATDAPELVKLKNIRKVSAWVVPAGFLMAFLAAMLLEHWGDEARTQRAISLCAITSLVGVAVFSAVHAWILERTKPVSPRTTRWPAIQPMPGDLKPLYSDSWSESERR